MKSLFLLFSLFISINSYGTFQRFDLIIIEKDTLPLLTSIAEISDFSSFYDSYRKSSGFSTNCYRGYYAIFELKQDSLYLNCLVECVSEEKIKLDKLGGENPLFWDWYSNSIKLGLGQCLSFVGPASVFEENRILKFNSGILIGDTSFIDETAVQDAINFKKIYVLGGLLSDSLGAHMENQFVQYAICESDYFPVCSENYRFRLKPNGQIGRVHFYLDWPSTFKENVYGIMHPSCLRKVKKALKEYDFKGYDLPSEDVIVILDSYCHENNLNFLVQVWLEKMFNHVRKKSE